VKHKGGLEPWRFGRIEIGGRDGGVEGDDQPSLWCALRGGIPICERDHYGDNEWNQHMSKHMIPPLKIHVSPLTALATARRRDCRSRSCGWGRSSSHMAARRL